MAKKPKQPKSLAEQLREAIDGSALTRYQICKRSGVDHAQISRFMAGERDLLLESAGKVAAVLGLKLSKGE